MTTSEFKMNKRNGGDVLTVTKTAAGWQSPTTGEVAPNRAIAMRREIREYLAASGKQVAEHQVCLPEFGEWVE